MAPTFAACGGTEFSAHHGPAMPGAQGVPAKGTLVAVRPKTRSREIRNVTGGVARAREYCGWRASAFAGKVGPDGNEASGTAP